MTAPAARPRADLRPPAPGFPTDERPLTEECLAELVERVVCRFPREERASRRRATAREAARKARRAS